MEPLDSTLRTSPGLRSPPRLDGLRVGDKTFAGLPGLEGRLLTRSVSHQVLRTGEEIEGQVTNLVGPAIGRKTAVFLRAESLRALLPPCRTPAGELALRRHLLNPPATVEGVLAMRQTLDLINTNSEVRDSLTRMTRYAESDSILCISHYESAVTISSLRARFRKDDNITLKMVLLQPIVFFFQSNGILAAQRRALRTLIEKGAAIQGAGGSVLESIRTGFEKLRESSAARWLKGNLWLTLRDVFPFSSGPKLGFPMLPVTPPFEVYACATGWYFLTKALIDAAIQSGSAKATLVAQVGQWAGLYGMFIGYTGLQFLARARVKRKIARSSLPLALDLLGEVDALLTLADFRAAMQKKGWSEPEISNADEFHACHSGLRNAIVEEESGRCVSNDFEIKSNQIKIVTGPNSGGKTTLAQALVHAQILAQLGLPVPSQRSLVTPADQLFYVGPQHAVNEDEGRFGTELESGSEVIDLATPRSLVILDELAGGTNSGEQTEIASGVLDGLERIEAPTVLITHDFNLARLQSSRGSDCWMVGKDGEVRNYKLEPGISESSGAMDIARKLRMDPESIRDRVLRRVGPADVSAEHPSV